MDYLPDTGMLLTCYAPLRRSPPSCIATTVAAPRLACVKPAASVHPEPGSNSSLYIIFISFADPRLASLNFEFIKFRNCSFANFHLLLVFCLSVFQSTFASSNSIIVSRCDPLFSFGIAKVRTIFTIPNLFHLFFNFFQVLFRSTPPGIT